MNKRVIVVTGPTASGENGSGRIYRKKKPAPPASFLLILCRYTGK